MYITLGHREGSLHWEVTQLFGYKNVSLKYIGIYLPGWPNLGGVVYARNHFRVELVCNQQLCYDLKIWELTVHICR